MVLRLTPYNVEETLGIYPEHLPHVLPLVFTELLNPNVQEDTLRIYVVGTITSLFFGISLIIIGTRKR